MPRGGGRALRETSRGLRNLLAKMAGSGRLGGNAPLHSRSRRGPHHAGRVGFQIMAIVTPKPAPKWMRVLRALLQAPHTSRQLEEPPVFDHVAHSTAAELRKKGVRLEVEIVEIVGYAGCSARVARYSIAEESRQHAEWLLAGGR